MQREPFMMDLASLVFLSVISANLPHCPDF